MAEPDFEAYYVELRQAVRDWIRAEYRFRRFDNYNSDVSQGRYVEAECRLRALALRGLKPKEAKRTLRQRFAWLSQAARLLGFPLADRFHSPRENEEHPQRYLFPDVGPKAPPKKQPSKRKKKRAVRRGFL